MKKSGSATMYRLGAHLEQIAASRGAAHTEAEISAEERKVRHVTRLLKQGLRRFQIVGGPVGFVIAYDVRRGTATLERPIKRLKNARTGKRLKKPRIERIVQTVPLHKLSLVVDHDHVQRDAQTRLNATLAGIQ